MKRRHIRKKRTTPLIRSLAGKLLLVIAVSLALRIASDSIAAPVSALARRFNASPLALLLMRGELMPPALAGDGDIGLRLMRMELPLRLPDKEPEPPQEDAPPDSEPPQAAQPEEPAETETPEPPPPNEPDTPAPVETSITGQNGQYYMAAEGIYLKNNTDYEIDIEALLSAELGFSAAEGAEVLIIHTHATEAYTPDGDDTYVPSEPYRTLDATQSVIRVGDELERILTERGITVTHDTGLYDYPAYNSSYSRAYTSIEEHLAENPNIKVVIDLHRDALEGADGTVYKTVADVGDTPSAQVEIIAGTDFTGLVHPNWRQNLAFAMKLQAEMVTKYPSLARPLYISQYRYNQHATTGSLIIEVGCSGNTLGEALAAVTYFGDCLADVLENG